MKCNHDISEKDTEVADGACPLCMAAELAELRKALEEARAVICKMTFLDGAAAHWMEKYGGDA